MTNVAPPRDCEDIRERLALQALEGALTDASPDVAEHCESCADCAAIRDEYDSVAGMLAFGLPDAPASPATRDRLRLRIAASKPPRRRSWFRPAAIAAAFALVLAVGLVAGLWLGESGEQQTSQDMLEGVSRGDRFALRPADAGKGSWGDVLIDRESGAAVLAAYNLPPLPADHIYQFWFLRTDGTRLDAKSFRPDASGNALHVVALPSDFETVRGVWVTLEPGSGSEWPQGPNVLITRWK